MIKHSQTQTTSNWENVAIQDITVKIGDFGLSRMVAASRTQQSLTQVGTKDYWAPEVEDFNAYYHKPADIYSLGVIIFHLKKKELPTLDERNALHNGQWAPKDKIEELIAQTMSYDAKDRPTAAEARNFLCGAFDMSIRRPEMTVVEVEDIATSMC